MAMSEPTPPTRRRWYQFGLGTMLVVTAIVAVWLAWELSYIRERQAWLRDNPAFVHRMEPGEETALPEPHISWWRGCLGDDAVQLIVCPAGWSESERDRVQTMFPEATLGFALDSAPADSTFDLDSSSAAGKSATPAPQP
jgi:hypothetical protein